MDLNQGQSLVFKHLGSVHALFCFPGICEPMGSAKCQGKNAEGICAKSAEYECDFNVFGVDNGMYCSIFIPSHTNN